MSLDEAEVSFVRKPETLEPRILQTLAGSYEDPTGSKFRVVLKEDGKLCLIRPGRPEQKLLPYRGLKFHVQDFSDLTFEFVMENGRPAGLKQLGASGEYFNKRQE